MKQSSNTTPQAQKILKKHGLKEINNAVFLRSDPETLKDLILIQDYITYGYPTKAIVNELIRKRGFLNKDNQRMPLMNNALIEELLGAANIICVEDIVASLWKCSEPEMNFEAVKKVLWPI